MTETIIEIRHEGGLVERFRFVPNKQPVCGDFAMECDDDGISMVCLIEEPGLLDYVGAFEKIDDVPPQSSHYFPPLRRPGC